LYEEGTVDAALPVALSIPKNKGFFHRADAQTSTHFSPAHPFIRSVLGQAAQGRENAWAMIPDFKRSVPTQTTPPSLRSVSEAAGLNQGSLAVLVAAVMKRPNLGRERKVSAGGDFRKMILGQNTIAPVVR
jgi:hypothetical protein